jgi:hypothetical protein
MPVDAGMAGTKPGTPPVRARIGNTGEGGRRQPAPCLSHQPRDEELPINHLDEVEPVAGFYLALELGDGTLRRQQR